MTAAIARLFRPRKWWSLSGSNRRPPACKAGALPAELRPHSGVAHADDPRGRRLRWRGSQAIRRPSGLRAPCPELPGPTKSAGREAYKPDTDVSADLVGPGRFELPTSPLSGVRSNQLSYGPEPYVRSEKRSSQADMTSTRRPNLHRRFSGQGCVIH